MNVAQFRANVSHLENLFHVKRHACVGDEEKEYFESILTNVLSDVERLDCKTVKPADLERQREIIDHVDNFLKSKNEINPDQFDMFSV